MRTLIVIDGENVFNDVVRSKVSEMDNVHPIVVMGKRQQIKGAACEDIGVVKVDCDYKNAVDFVVVSVVASKMATKKYDKAMILSDDNGFEPAVQYLKSIGYDVRRTSYKDFVKGKDKSDDALSKMVISCCGYMNNHLESGVNKEAFTKHLKDLFGKNASLVNSTLAKNNLISSDKHRVYFNKHKLSAVAKGKYFV